MPDQNLPTPPSNEALQTAKSGFVATVKDLWGKYSIFFIVVGVILLIAKFNDIIMEIIGWKSKKDVEQAQKVDQKLKAEEDAANKQANDLIKKADELPNTKGKVDENWNKKGN